VPTGPLSNLLVLDFTRAVAGPFCTMLLADLGARVIKVEDPQGDEARNWGPPFVNDWSTYFLSINRNKESIVLDLKNPAHLATARKLAARANIAIENFRPGVAARLGIGYEALSAINPNLIYCSISGFGQTGLWSQRPGYDLIIQALSGFMHASAEPQGTPVKAAFPIADILTGLFAEQAILAALQVGKGQLIEVSLIDSLLAAMTPLATAYLNTGIEPRQMGRAQPNIVPYQVFRCADAYIAAGTPNNRQFERFAQALGHPEWPRDPRYATNPSRNANRAALIAEIEQVLSKLTAADALSALEAQEIPCAPVSTIGATLDNPALAQNIVDVGIRTIAHPARFSTSTPNYKHPPRLGEHTQSILTWLEETDGK